MNELEKKLLDLISTLKNCKSPALFLGSCSITRLRSFIDGLCFAYSFPTLYRPHFFIEFGKCVEEKYAPNGTAKGWNTLLLEHAKDEEKGLDLFFREMEIFLSRNNIELPTESRWL